MDFFLRCRPTIKDCLNHSWLHDSYLKKLRRQTLTFTTTRLKEFLEEHQRRCAESATKHKVLLRVYQSGSSSPTSPTKFTKHTYQWRKTLTLNRIRLWIPWELENACWKLYPGVSLMTPVIWVIWEQNRLYLTNNNNKIKKHWLYVNGVDNRKVGC